MEDENMNTLTILTPKPRNGVLPQLSPFKEDDILYKIVEGRKCSYLVIQIAGEQRLRLRAYDNDGALSNHTFVIDQRQIGLYKLDSLATKLRKAFYDLKRLHEQELEQN
jgi:hypothetical protein